MRRLRRLVLCAAGSIAVGGCTHDGGFEVSWDFLEAAGGHQSAANGCGAHGVDAILVTGSSTGGDGTSVIGLCTPGVLEHRIPAGVWTFELHTLDTRGRAIQPIDQPDGTTDAMEIKQGDTPQIFPTVTITPRPECEDGIDNDRDGRVDGDDPDCVAALAALAAGDLETIKAATEATPAGPTPDGGVR
jgi:hypothetical protein